MPIESHPSELTNPERGPAAALSPQEALPGLAAAFDEEAMKGHMQAVLFGSGRSSYTVERCTPTRPLYVAGEYCVLRYRFEARKHTSREVLEPIVMGRVFPDRPTCAAYMSDKLAPLAARMRGRPEVAAFGAPAATIEPLNMVVHVWPVDGELPTLVDATDRDLMVDVFQETLPETLGQQFVVDDCGIELVSYRRRQRCVLRYTVAGRATGGGEARRLIAYGKVTGVGDGTLTSRIIDALGNRMLRGGVPPQFTLPRSFGWRPELRLSLLEALPGEAQIGPALKARLRDRLPPEAPPLEEMVATCAYVGASLHTSGVDLGRARTLDDELAGLAREIAMVRQFVPQVGDRAESWLERIAARAEQSEPLPPCLSHGDFKHEQLLFDGARAGLVDFDAICQAEPALDLGKFSAHLRTEARKVRARATVRSTLGEELAEQFLRAYLTRAGDQGPEQQLRERTTLYEAIALLRLTLRGHQDLDETRSQATAALLEERLS